MHRRNQDGLERGTEAAMGGDLGLMNRFGSVKIELEIGRTWIRSDPLTGAARLFSHLLFPGEVTYISNNPFGVTSVACGSSMQVISHYRGRGGGV